MAGFEKYEALAGLVVALLIGVAQVWVTFYLARPGRRLAYGLSLVAPFPESSQDRPSGAAWDELADRACALEAPHIVEICVTARGRRDIPRSAFDGDEPIRLRCQATIARLVGVASRPTTLPVPEVVLAGDEHSPRSYREYRERTIRLDESLARTERAVGEAKNLIARAEAGEPVEEDISRFGDMYGYVLRGRPIEDLDALREVVQELIERDRREHGRLVDRDTILLGPSLIGRRQLIRITALVDGVPLLTCTSPLIDVRTVRYRPVEVEPIRRWGTIGWLLMTGAVGYGLMSWLTTAALPVWATWLVFVAVMSPLQALGTAYLKLRSDREYTDLWRADVGTA